MAGPGQGVSPAVGMVGSGSKGTGKWLNAQRKGQGTHLDHVDGIGGNGTCQSSQETSPEKHSHISHYQLRNTET